MIIYGMTLLQVGLEHVQKISISCVSKVGYEKEKSNILLQDIGYLHLQGAPPPRPQRLQHKTAHTT